MNIVLFEINLGFQQLTPTNTCLIDDCPYKCVSNAPNSYVLPHLFDLEVEDNYLMGNLWPYSFGLLEVPIILQYLAFNPHGKQQIKVRSQSNEPT
jgi:hypothetical protein